MDEAVEILERCLVQGYRRGKGFPTPKPALKVSRLRSVPRICLNLMCLAGALILPTEVGATTNEELRVKIEILEAQLEAIKHQLLLQDEAPILIEPKLEINSANQLVTKHGLGLGNTTFDISGFIDLDVHLTKFSDGELPSESLGRDLYIPQLVPINQTSGQESGYDADFSVQTSRVGLSTSTPLGQKNVSTMLEVDFLISPGGNEGVSNSFNPRLRRAYIDYGNWRVGQDWSTFQALQAMPESVSFFAPAESQVFVRQPVIRYTLGDFQFALENPNTNVHGVGLVDDGLIPDIVLRYNWSQEMFDISMSGLVRDLRYETENFKGSAIGWGASLAGRVHLGKDDLRFSIQRGDGLGRYVGIGISPGAVVKANGNDIEAIPTVSGNIAYRKVFGPISISGGVSIINIDNPVALTGDQVTKSSQSGFVAVSRSLDTGFTVGMEFLTGARKIESGEKGNIRRITFSTRKTF